VTSNRSKAFHDVCWKNLRDAGFPDRILWLRAAAKKFPAMDLSRVGIYGTSAGGQDALRGLLDHGDFYQAGVADSGCYDNRMDKIWWNEQWMGWPVDDSYTRSSCVTDAHKLRGKLLLMAGELDKNVDPASTMQVVNALVKADKDGNEVWQNTYGTDGAVNALMVLSDGSFLMAGSLNNRLAMIKAGEVGGILDTILERLSAFLESSEALRAKVKSALMYPAVVFSVAMLITVGLVLFVIPIFKDIFSSFGAQLPFLTRMGWPTGRPRKSTGCTRFTFMLSGRRTLVLPELPASSQSRRTVPGPSGFEPYAVTIIPLRDTSTPCWLTGNAPGPPSDVAASKGLRASSEGMMIAASAA